MVWCYQSSKAEKNNLGYPYKLTLVGKAPSYNISIWQQSSNDTLRQQLMSLIYCRALMVESSGLKLSVGNWKH